MEKISVIIPCYNVEKQIDRCVQSLVSQTIGMKQLELIFVDDASTDHTMEKLTEWEGRYPENIMVVHCEENGKQGAARNIGMSYASGDFIGFVDSDDWVDPDMYQVLFDAIHKYDCELAAIKFQRETEDGRVLEIDKRTFPYEKRMTINTMEERKRFFDSGLPGGVYTKLYRRDFLVAHKLYFPEHLYYEDNFFAGIMRFCLTSYVILDKRMYHYMVNQDSTIMGTGTRHLDRLKIEMMKIEELIKRGYMDMYHDEIEFSFLTTYWCNTIFQLFTKFPVIPYEIIDVMRRTVKGWFPDYLSNPYLEKMNETEKMIIKMIEVELTNEEINQLAEVYREGVLQYWKELNQESSR